MKKKIYFGSNFEKKHYSNISLEDRINIEHQSRLIKAYFDADDDAKKILWFKYDNDTQKYCDYTKWQEIKQEKANMKIYFKMLIPDQDDQELTWYCR